LKFTIEKAYSFDMAWKMHGKLAGKVMLRAYRDLWYRIGTFSMGGYGYAAASLVNGEMLPLAL